MKVGWSFDRGNPQPDGRETAIRCRFTVGDDGGQAMIDFVIPESAALELVDAIRQAASPLSIANGLG